MRVYELDLYKNFLGKNRLKEVARSGGDFLGQYLPEFLNHLRIFDSVGDFATRPGNNGSALAQDVYQLSKDALRGFDCDQV
jgi:hypothetical protein